MSGYLGSEDQDSTNSDLNAHTFLISQLIGKMATAMVVKVLAVTNAGGISSVGRVDVLPLVNQIDGNGNATPHGTINDLPYFRLQGGTNAVILDPQVGDIGIMVFCSRDISAVKATKAQANPGSLRRHDFADGVYIGMCLGGTPQQYIAYSATGIDILSPMKVTITAPEVDVSATMKVVITSPEVDITAATKVAVTSPLVTLTGNLQVLGDITGGFGGGDQIGLRTHRHGTGTNAAGTVIPTPGT